MTLQRFGWSLWRWTSSKENLYLLNADELDWFKRLITHAEASEYEN